MSKPLAVAIFGVGSQVQPYLAALQNRNDVLVIAVGDSDSNAAKQAAAVWSARVWTEPVAMLREEAPEAFFALAPPMQLENALEQAATQHIPFFVIPPGVSDWPAVVRLQRMVEEQSLLAAMAFPYRTTDIVREAKEFLDKQPLHLARATWFVPAQSPLPEVLWHGTCVLVDLLRFFLGDIRTVFAVGSEEALLLTLHAVNGTVASFALRTQQLPEPRIELELPGEKWSLLFAENMSRLHFTEPSKTTILRQMNQPHAEQLTAFLDAVRRQDASRISCSFAEGLKTLAVIEAARQSLARQQPVGVVPV